MDLTLALELVGAILIGMALGLLGAGGSILTVPVLVYLVGEPPKAAIAESLVIVGVIASAASVRYAVQRTIHWRTAFLVGAPGIVGAFAGATLARFLDGKVQLLLLAVTLLVAAWRMLATPEPAADRPPPSPSLAKPIATGLAVGLLTGLIGVGGGFLLVPALALALGLPMRQAIATSLAIIVLNSAAGFAQHSTSLAEAGVAIDWRAVTIFATLGVVGTLVGTGLAPRIPQRILRRSFAGVLIAVAVGVLVVELGVRR
jgi:uncharacterized membrane protein YfcA